MGHAIGAFSSQLGSHILKRPPVVEHPRDSSKGIAYEAPQDETPRDQLQAAARYQRDQDVGLTCIKTHDSGIAAEDGPESVEVKRDGVGLRARAHIQGVGEVCQECIDMGEFEVDDALR